MKFTLTWLKDHLETEASVDEIVDALNVIGLEVEGLDDPSAKLAAFEVAEIIDAQPHPDADRLRVCTVQSQRGTHQVVCGAPNARAGLRGIFAHEGAVIPANGMTLTKAKIRGVESRGMMCSEAELELSDAHDGIIELGSDIAIGTPAAQALGLNDPVFEIAITPNRPDCLGVRGIARDLAAYGLGSLKPDLDMNIPNGPACPIDVSVDGEKCLGFAGRVISGVQNGPSPDWLKTRLKAIGLRSINALVDITNYISYDRGRPLHVYDADKLSGPIAARSAASGESFVTLDDVDVTLTPDDCVIADARSVLGLAGIMGGAQSGSELETKNVFIESAFFEATTIALSGRRHNINSDARYRFERGVDPKSIMFGLDLATKMILDICGGTASAATLAGGEPDLGYQTDFDPALVAKLSGVEMDVEQMRQILIKLGFDVVPSGHIWRVTAPSWRPDILGNADLVEEIVRIYGLDKVPSLPLPMTKTIAKPILTDAQKRQRLARRILAGRGLVEAVTWSFVSEAQAMAFGGDPALKLANPISAELSNMRPSLLPGLVSAAERNMSRGANDFGLFEVGNVFHALAPGAQSLMATSIRIGARTQRSWAQTQVPFDTFDAKADVISVLVGLGVDEQTLKTSTSVPDYYHPGRSGVLFRDPKTPLAYFGTLHPRLVDELGLSCDVVCSELFVMNLPIAKKKSHKTKAALELSPFQTVKRDFAFEVSEEVAADDILRAARGADRKLITNTLIFDVFRGKGVAEGHKSVGLEVTLSPKSATLTDAEIDAAMNAVIEAVAKACGGKLRG